MSFSGCYRFEPESGWHVLAISRPRRQTNAEFAAEVEATLRGRLEGPFSWRWAENSARADRMELAFSSHRDHTLAVLTFSGGLPDLFA